jgi:7-cyano-7-deazaguanine synthase in queuosine biosynthesis
MGIVTLVSGGYDSTLMSLMAHEEGILLHPLFVDYGQLGATKEWQDICVGNLGGIRYSCMAVQTAGKGVETA